MRRRTSSSVARLDWGPIGIQARSYAAPVHDQAGSATHARVDELAAVWVCVNRGDSTPIELFVQGILSWGPETRVLLAVKP